MNFTAYARPLGAPNGGRRSRFCSTLSRAQPGAAMSERTLKPYKIEYLEESHG
jgi:hypothetical protein